MLATDIWQIVLKHIAYTLYRRGNYVFTGESMYVITDTCYNQNKDGTIADDIS